MAYMSKTATTIALAAAVAVSALLAGGADTATVGPSITGGLPEDVEMVEWALDRFAEAGLHLPPVVFEFAGPSLSSCGGAQARAYLDQEPVIVRVCWGSKFVMLHELAHVWEAGRLQPDVEANFMRLRLAQDRNALQTWANPSLPWASQGREHAANVIAWGVMDEPTVVGGTYPNDRENLVVAYRLLTGLEPTHTEGGEPHLIDRSAFEATRAVDPVGGR